MDCERIHTQKVSNDEMHKKFSLLGKGFQTEMVNLITSYNGKINKEMIDLADEICDLQEKLSATTETCNQLFVTVNELRDENENLRNNIEVAKTQTRPENPDQREIDTNFEDVLLQISDEDSSDSEESDVEEGTMKSVQVNCESDNHEESVDFNVPTIQKHSKVIEADANENGTQSETLNQREPEGRILINSNTSKDENRIHLKNDKSNGHVCPNCDLSFSTTFNLKRHIQGVHNIIKNHICNLCGYATSQPGTLKIHIKGKHEKIKDHICYLCGYATSMLGTLKAHIKGKHEKIRDHTCEECGYATSRKHNLEAHRNSVHNIGVNLKCEQCPYESYWRSTMAKHTRENHNKKLTDNKDIV